MGKPRSLKEYVFEKKLVEKYIGTCEEEARQHLEDLYGENEAKEFELTDVTTFVEKA
jgi:hypothetical protein